MKPFHLKYQTPLALVMLLKRLGMLVLTRKKELVIYCKNIMLTSFQDSRHFVKLAFYTFINFFACFTQDNLRQTTPTPIVGTTFGDMPPVEPFHKQQVPAPISAPSPDFVGLGSSNMTPSLEFQFMRGDPPTPSTHPTQPSFPSMFTEKTNVTASSKQDLGGGVDGQYVPETGQQMNEKSDLVGSPVVGALSTDDQSNGATYPSKPQGNGKVKLTCQMSECNVFSVPYC